MKVVLRKVDKSGVISYENDTLTVPYTTRESVRCIVSRINRACRQHGLPFRARLVH